MLVLCFGVLASDLCWIVCCVDAMMSDMTRHVLLLCAVYNGRSLRTAQCTRPTSPVRDVCDEKHC